MTITYANGTSLRAIVLSHGDNEIRATAAGYDDTLAFHWYKGSWVSDDLEPVILKSEARHTDADPALREADYVCPKELVAHLVQTLHSGCTGGTVTEDGFRVFSSAESRVALHQDELGGIIAGHRERYQ